MLRVAPVVLAMTVAPVTGLETATAGFPTLPVPPTIRPVAVAEMSTPIGPGSTRRPPVAVAPTVIVSPHEPAGMFEIVTTDDPGVVPAPLNVIVLAAGESVNGSAT